MQAGAGQVSGPWSGASGAGIRGGVGGGAEDGGTLPLRMSDVGVDMQGQPRPWFAGSGGLHRWQGAGPWRQRGSRQQRLRLARLSTFCTLARSSWL